MESKKTESHQGRVKIHKDKLFLPKDRDAILSGKKEINVAETINNIIKSDLDRIVSLVVKGVTTGVVMDSHQRKYARDKIDKSESPFARVQASTRIATGLRLLEFVYKIPARAPLDDTEKSAADLLAEINGGV